MLSKAARTRLAYASGLGVGVVAFFLGALLEPGVDAAANDREAMAIIQNDPLGQRLSHLAYATSGLGFAAAGWSLLKLHAGPPRTRLVWAGAIGLGAGGLGLSASSLVVATLVVDAALRADESAFAALHAAAGQGFAMMIPLGVGLANVALLAFQTSTGKAAKAVHGAGAVAGAGTAIGLFGALVLDYEPLAMLAGTILLLPPWLVFHVVTVMWGMIRGRGQEPSGSLNVGLPPSSLKGGEN